VPCHSTCFNGTKWERYVCHRMFNSAYLLSYYLNSPVYQQKVYRCHNMNCDIKLAGLFGLFTHLGSETCVARRFEIVPQAQRAFGNGVIDGKLVIDS
jgi:hypothetical protein